ncbi:hypothetical protein TorRG33x02_340700 [Trema orientale]|uniref:Uncharacterized protein n=1 Tax=Trema orientale TaxID=63057 RepID=A0A2P5AUT1_TREOI|nr:hypothetical protein TorRG33x02_340700 [Trema orientale]
MAAEENRPRATTWRSGTRPRQCDDVATGGCVGVDDVAKVTLGGDEGSGLSGGEVYLGKRMSMTEQVPAKRRQDAAGLGGESQVACLTVSVQSPTQ